MHTLRPAVPDDYDAIAAVVDDWWGRPVLPALPRLFLDHFHSTSLIASSGTGALAGFLIGFPSPSLPDEAYIHFVGVSPAARKSGLARIMYERFFDLARGHGRLVVRAVTAPVNETSIAFHRRMGFEAGDPVPGYNGPGTSLVTFVREI
ncbi:N-acetyltransferase family protein [Nonomuraea sp. MTCD27]|uniref:GNAT family N-acetyltransferase n=1 Tax=Nonomuraea sp. MTCD27 TaxID=1676747 RepID=UPI0035C0B850